MANVPPPASSVLRHEPRAFADLRQEDIVDLSSQLASCFGVHRVCIADADIHHFAFSGRTVHWAKENPQGAALEGSIRIFPSCGFHNPVHWLEKAAEVPLIESQTIPRVPPPKERQLRQRNEISKTGNGRGLLSPVLIPMYNWPGLTRRWLTLREEKLEQRRTKTITENRPNGNQRKRVAQEANRSESNGLDQRLQSPGK